MELHSKAYGINNQGQFRLKKRRFLTRRTYTSCSCLHFADAAHVVAEGKGISLPDVH